MVAVLQPIAHYHERDLPAPGDGALLSDYRAPRGGGSDALLPGEVGEAGEVEHGAAVESEDLRAAVKELLG